MSEVSVSLWFQSQVPGAEEAQVGAVLSFGAQGGGPTGAVSCHASSKA